MAKAVILGAGFSRCAALPTQAELARLLLAPEFEQGPLQKCISKAIRDYLQGVFGWREGQPLPSLEDYFTCLDLSSSTGHHLGIRYTPKKLRALRRMTLHRVLQILDREYQPSPAIKTFLSRVLTDGAGFVVLNWDIVLERGLQDQQQGPRIDYGFECYDREPGRKKERAPSDIAVCKINGSSNWTYCDNCASVFYDLNRKLALQEMVGLVKADFRLFDESLTGSAFDEALGVSPQHRECRFCRNMLTTHMATFSFRKSFRTHAYPAIWHNARRLLSESSEWIFAGYSLPDADYEFKHLLKVAELALGKRKDLQPLSIQVVLKDNAAAEGRYRGLFGRRIQRVWQGGLEEFVA